MTGQSSTPPLAIDGGTATFPNGPPTWSAMAADPKLVRQALEQLADSGEWATYHGPYTDQVAECITNLTSQPHVRLCSSGTIAVELALRGLGVSAGDEVVLGGYDFPGNFRAIESIGARPVLVDIDKATGCVGVAQLKTALSPAGSDDSKITCAIVSHLHGGLATMKAIMDWGSQHRVTILEDACQAPGATVDGHAAGSWGDASVFSFGGSKLLTAGRGGAVACRQPEVAQRMTIWADRGNDAFPLSQLQAAVLPMQFDRLVEQNAIRQRSGRRLRESLADCHGITTLWNEDGPSHQPAGYKFGIWLCPERFDATKVARWIAAAQAEGIAIDRGFRGFMRRSERRCRKASSLPNATRASEHGVVLHHPVLLQSEETIDRLADAIRRVTNTLLVSRDA